MSGGNAFQQQPYDPPNTKQSKSGCWFWGLIGGGFLFLIILCCGGGALVVGFGMNIVEQDLRNQLRDRPAVRQHLGEIQEFDMNFMKSAATADEDTFVYDVEGSKGSAEITIKSEDFEDGTSEILTAEMRLPTGETIDLMEEEAEALPEDF